MQVKMRVLAVVILIWVAAVPEVASAERLRIVVGGPNFRPYPVAAPTLVVLGGKEKAAKRLLKELTQLLQAGIDVARPLELVPPTTYLNAKGESWIEPTFVNWVNVGASGLIRGGLEVAGNEVKITLRYFDVIAQQEILTRSYKEPRKRVGTAVLRFLDAVIAALTGEAGIFSSRIAYVKRTAGGKAVFICDVHGHNVERITPKTGLSLLPAWDTTGHNLLFTSYLKNNPDLYRKNITTRKLEWLSNKRGLNTGAAVSPNGKRIALTLSIDGNTEIYVMDWSGEDLKRLTNSWGQDVSPSWSPDGKRLVFVSSRSGDPHLYVMNANGSAPRRLTFQGNYNQEPDWSPRADGQIAFTARDERNKFDIFLVHPESGEVTRLTQDEGNNESPSHSPDGHQIVFTSTRPPGAGKALYLMDVDGRNQRRISRDRGGESETPAWGPRTSYE